MEEWKKIQNCITTHATLENETNCCTRCSGHFLSLPISLSLSAPLLLYFSLSLEVRDPYRGCSRAISLRRRLTDAFLNSWENSVNGFPSLPRSFFSPSSLFLSLSRARVSFPFPPANKSLKSSSHVIHFLAVFDD